MCSHVRSAFEVNGVACTLFGRESRKATTTTVRWWLSSPIIVCRQKVVDWVCIPVVLCFRRVCSVVEKTE